MHQKTLICGLLLIMLSFSAQAGISTVLHKTKIRSCELTFTHDTVPGKKGVIVLRQTPDGKIPCNTKAAEIVRPLQTAMRNYKANKSLSEITGILLLGHLHSYKWLADYLQQTARTDPKWDAKTGKPVTGHENTWVNNTLFNDKLMAPFNQAVAAYRYKISGVHCEKVLISPESKLPFSATCWLKLGRLDKTPTP